MIKSVRFIAAKKFTIAQLSSNQFCSSSAPKDNNVTNTQKLFDKFKKLLRPKEEEKPTVLDIQKPKPTVLKRDPLADVSVLNRAEHLIKTSINRGEFDNLSGTGRPLNTAPRQTASTTPEWITLGKQIELDVKELRQNMLRFMIHKINMQEHPNLLQLTIDKCDDDVARLNRRINEYNLSCPIVTSHMMHINMHYEINKAAEIIEAGGEKIFEQRYNEEYDDSGKNVKNDAQQTTPPPAGVVLMKIMATGKLPSHFPKTKKLEKSARNLRAFFTSTLLLLVILFIRERQQIVD